MEITSTELEKLYSRLEEVEHLTGLEWCNGFATRVILGNLVMLLSNGKVIDGHSFLEVVKQGLNQVPDIGERIAAEGLINDLVDQLNHHELYGYAYGKTVH